MQTRDHTINAVEFKQLWPAQITFTQGTSGRRWRGRLLNSAVCVDVQRHGHVAAGARFDIEELPAGQVVATIQGAQASGRRYRMYSSVDDAQLAGLRWAARRFRCEG